MRVLVCGGRDFADWDKVRTALDGLRIALNVEQFIVIHGGASGADSLAGRWANRRGFLQKIYPADWKMHGKAAGPIRNQQMIDDGQPHIVVAFPGGRGTADMVRRAKAAGIRVEEIEP